MATELLLLLLTFLSLAIFLWQWRLLRNNHSPVRQWPLLGMSPSVLRSLYDGTLHDFVTGALRRAGGTFLLKGPSFINADYLVTGDAMNVQHICSSKNAGNYEKSRHFRDIMEFLGDGIFNVDGELWKFQRKLVHSLLNNSDFEGHALRTLERKTKSTLFPVLDEVVTSSRTGTWEVVDVQDVIKRLMFDSMCLLVLGFDPCYLSGVGSGRCGGGRVLPECECGKALDDLEEVVVYRHLVPMCVWRLQHRLRIGMERKCIRAWSVMDEFLYGSIKAKKQELATKNSVVAIGNDKMDLLTQILITKDEDDDNDDDGKTIVDKTSDKFLRDTMLTLLAAGKDTISASLTWLIWLVASHPTVEEKILEELRQVMVARRRQNDDVDEGGGFLNKDDLDKLVYLHATIYETLRLYPPVPFDHRCAIDDDVLPSGYRVRRDERILFSIYSMARMEEIWGKDCMDFKPERWISAKGTIVHVPSYKFMAFQTGARACPGKTITFMQVTSLASAIMWNYKLELVDSADVRPAVGMVLFMKDGLKMRVSKREQY